MQGSNTHSGTGRVIHAVDEERDRRYADQQCRAPITLCGRLAPASHDSSRVTCGACLRALARQCETCGAPIARGDDCDHAGYDVAYALRRESMRRRGA